MTIPTFPGTNFDPVIDLYGSGNTLFLPVLVWLDFETDPAALWGGHYDFVAGGITWAGLGRSGIVTGIEGLEASSTMRSSDMTFSLSGVPSDILTIFSDVDRADYVGRMAAVYGQFCTSDWKPVEDVPPFAYAAGIMGTATISRVPAQNNKGWMRTISLPVSNVFYNRSGTQNSYLTDRDQQRRHPGDKFLSFVKDIQEISIPQPWIRGS